MILSTILKPVLALPFGRSLATLWGKSPLLPAFATSTMASRRKYVGVLSGIWMSVRAMSLELSLSFLIAITVPLRAACSAAAVAACGMNVRILRRVGMAVLANRLRPIHQSGCLAGYAALHVHSMRDRLQMSWVHASRVAAQVIHIKAIGDWSNERLIGESVGHYQPSAIPKLSITKRLGCSPYPASVSLIDFLPKPILSRHGRHVPFPCVFA
jgi:hypothetical protein